MTDQAIIALYWKREESAIQASDEAYGSYCYTVANNILDNREDSEECVNDTWLNAWNSMPPQRPNRLGAFLARITRNLAISRFRADRSQKRGGGQVPLALEELSECVSAPGSTEDTVIAWELEETVNRFLHTLPSRECSIFLSRYFNLDPVKAIAAQFGIRESNVLLILSRTRKKLRAHLEKEGYLQ